jgi:hypothetical protein
MLIKALVLIPTRYNDGKPVARRAFAEFEARFEAIEGAFSRRDDVEGAWSHEGVRYTDRSREYSVGVDSWRKIVAFLEVVDWAREEFAQLEMYIEIMGVAETLGP